MTGAGGWDAARGSLDQAFDEVQIGLSLITPDAVVTRVNAAGAGLLGLVPADLIGVPLTDLLHDDDGEAALAELARLQRDGSAGPILVRLRRADGEWRSIRAHATLLVGEPPVGFIVFEDVTEELAVAEALREAEERSARRYAQQLSIAELGRLALSGAAPEVVAQRASELVFEHLDAVQAGVLLDDGHEGGLLQIAGAGAFAEMTGEYRRPRDQRWLEVLASGEPLFIEDVLDESVTLSAEERVVSAAAGLRSVVLTPIVPAKARPAVIVASSDRPVAFTRSDAGFLESLSHVIAASLDSARAVGELRHQALHDPLTSLPNRALVLEHLEVALRRARRHGGQVAVVMCDLDRFKVINDTHGHAVGDEVLRAVGQRIASHLRPGDLVGRFGGDELVVVLTELDEDTAPAVAARLVETARAPIGTGGITIRATISAGVATSHSVDEDGSSLLRRADTAMYDAKAAGRDRVVVAP